LISYARAVLENGCDPCIKCDELTDNGKIKKQDCENCTTPRLGQDNVFIWVLCSAVTPGLFDSSGGVSYQAVDVVLRAYGVSNDPGILDLIVGYAAAIRDDNIKRRR
jgi:hypothetical protein